SPAAEGELVPGRRDGGRHGRDAVRAARQERAGDRASGAAPLGLAAHLQGDQHRCHRATLHHGHHRPAL
ncbi:hypothetical protein LSTR_LSTR016794, partial [Laodelphax striatellus]